MVRAILPGQHVSMSLIFREDRVTPSPVACPRCNVVLRNVELMNYIWLVSNWLVPLHAEHDGEGSLSM
jgi:hypothetical protein